jgi:hypothetical protein
MIPVIPTGLFAGLVEMQDLFVEIMRLFDYLSGLEKNAITFIGSAAFRGMTSLQLLYFVEVYAVLTVTSMLNNNPITAIDPTALTGLMSLELVYVHLSLMTR